jgi:hypothetical protein
MQDLFTNTRDFLGQVKRNIVSLRQSEDLFDDLTDGNENHSALAAALEAELKAKESLPLKIERGFHYSTAIDFPFGTDAWMGTRYSDGSFGVWYGGLDLKTTIHETAYHMMRLLYAEEGVNERVVRERCVYNVDCQAVLIDVCGKETDYPQLIASDDYSFTQSIGKRLHKEGHPGLLAPSARLANGVCLAAFNPRILRNPQIACYLTYTFDPKTGVVEVERTPGKVELEIRW